MNETVYRYQFEPDVPMEEAETSLVMAIIAAEALHGQPAVRLSLRYLFSEEKRACVIDGYNEIALHVVLVFTQFLLRQFGDDAFQVTQPARRRPEAASAGAGQAPDRPDGRGRGDCGACKACGKGVGA
ncbi:MAG: hypothetical protein GX595_11325 [Lentisphaerae bacterium]|nr:hypothetical protein [Lentisphaerota bacterium]